MKEFWQADGRTAWFWKNGTRTQRKMFMTEAECKKWVEKESRK